ncbi:translation initiation factor IF-2-like [Panthera tigris]|uniref:translation initiation factor IF-2-like n=1 Tax=Panthera tigris TaxID=9694 RepID=UPI001C6FBA43|nr:translation initiation factor IF-2-like [Panthera tigris]
MRMRGSGKNGVTQPPGLSSGNSGLPDQQSRTRPSSPASVRSRLLQCPRPSPRRRLPPEFRLRRGCGSRPLTSEGLSSDPLTSSAEGLTEPRPVPAAPRSGRGTVLLPTPGACGRVPARPRKSSGGRAAAAAAFQGWWQSATRTWPRASPATTPSQHQPFSVAGPASQRGRSPGAAGTFARGGPPRLCQMSSRQGNRLSRGARRPTGLDSAPEDPPLPPEPRQTPCRCPGTLGTLCTIREAPGV